MPATPRDREKPRAQRLEEVFLSEQLQAGQANAQQVIFGLELEAETKKFKVLPGEWAEDGVSLPKNLAAAITGISVPAAAQTGAGQKCIVLVEIKSTGAGTAEAFATAGAVTTGTPVLPALTAGRIAVGLLELPESFTPGTTEVKASMLKVITYSAGNVSPTGGF